MLRLGLVRCRLRLRVACFFLVGLVGWLAHVRNAVVWEVLATSIMVLAVGLGINEAQPDELWGSGISGNGYDRLESVRANREGCYTARSAAVIIPMLGAYSEVAGVSEVGY